MSDQVQVQDVEPTQVSTEQPTSEEPKVDSVQEPRKSDTEAENEQKLSFREALKKKVDEVEGRNGQEPKQEPNQQKPVNKEKKGPPPTIAPADMTKEEREAWEKGDPTLKAYVSRRAHQVRQELRRQSDAIAKKAQEYRGIEEAVTANREYLDNLGVTPDVLVRRAISWDKKIKENPKAAKEYLAAYGIDPIDLIDDDAATGAGHPSAQNQQLIDPEQIKAQIIEEFRQEQRKAQQSATVEQNFNVVQQFMREKPLFQDPATAAALESEMAPIVESLRAKHPQADTKSILERAYSYVTKGNEVFSGLLSSYEAREKAQKAQAAAQKAKSASRSISGSVASTKPSRTGLSFRDELALRARGAL